MVTYRSILKLILPPIIINIFKNIKKNFIQKDKNVDSRRFWDGEIIHSDDFKFKRIFKDFNLKTFAVTIKRETRDSIIVDPGKSEILYLKEFDNNEELFFGIGNLSEKAIINGSVEFILENNQDVKLRNPSKTKWENFKIKIESITMKATIIDQINKFLINLFDFELDLKNSGSTRIKTAIKKIAGTISSNPIF